MLRSICFILILAAAISTIARAADAPSTKPVAAIEHEMIRRADGATARTPATLPSEAGTRVMPVNSLDGKRVVLSLGVVIGAILIARYAMKKLFPAVSVGRNSQVIRVISRSVVGPKQQFLLVQLGKRLVLVGDSGASMSPLAQIEDPDEVASLVGQLQSESSTSSVGAFASFFRKAGSEFKREDNRALDIRPSLDHRADETADDRVNDEQPTGEMAAAATEVKDLMDRVRSLAKQVRQA